MVHPHDPSSRPSYRQQEPRAGSRMICTPDQRLRVFVSSTLKEMAAEREAARRADDRRLAPVMFELGARPHPARDLYRAYLAQSHIFVGIYGEQYGWVAPDMEISGLEDEYRLAGEKPRLIYINKPVEHREPRLQEMLHAIRDQDSLSYKYFTTPEELQDLVEGDLALLLTERFETSRGREEGTGTGSRQGNLPIPPTPIIGRDQEVLRARELLSDGTVRLVTLTGPGGSGKTRLNLKVAGELQEQFEQVWFVDLSAVTDSDLVASAIGQILGVREAGSRSPEAHLLDHVGNREFLFILDNFEQVSAAASLVARLLEQCPGLRVLATSRMALRLRGETELPVPPLPVPEQSGVDQTEVLARSASVALFCERARAVNPAFDLTGENAPVVAEICRRLDGLPLAIELAAVRIQLLTPQAMLIRLERRLPVLTGGARDLPDRQKTMRDTIAWSYDLLDPAAARLFRRMAVFVGGCSFSSLEAVCNADHEVGPEVMDALEALVEKNLVRSREGPAGEPRFEMLETIREFALERLDASGERSGIGQLHADYYVDLAETAETYYRSGEREPWLVRVETELGNLRVVFDRSVARHIKPETGIRLVGNLGWFCHLRGHLAEGRGWAEAMLRLAETYGSKDLRARALFPAGGLAWSQSDYRTAVRRLEESASLFRELGDSFWQVQAQVILSGVVASLGDYDRAYRLCLAGFTDVASRQGQHEHAARLAGAVRQPCRLVGILLVPDEEPSREEQMACSQEALGEEAWRKAFDEGRQMSTDVAIDYALQSGGLPDPRNGIG